MMVKYLGNIHTDIAIELSVLVAVSSRFSGSQPWNSAVLVPLYRSGGWGAFWSIVERIGELAREVPTAIGR
jgi:hypothetical protein